MRAIPAQPLPLEITIQTGKTLVRQGEPCAGVVVVVSGALMETCVSEQGRRLVHRVLGPGDPAGWADWNAASPVTVRAVRLSRLRPASQDELPSLLAAREAASVELASDLAWLDVVTRLERRLDDLACRFGRSAPGGTLVDLRLTHEDLAALTGSSRESASRAVRTLERAGRLSTIRRSRYLVRSSLEIVRA